MFQRALLMCEDVRVEVDGTLTLIGVYSDRLRVRAEPGPIVLEHLAFLLVVGGLQGVERVGFREHVRRVEHDDRPDQALAFEAHDPRAAEHNFVFGHAPMVFPEEGTYEVAIEIEAAMYHVTFRHRFSVERASFGSL